MNRLRDSKENLSRSPSLEVFMLGGVGQFGMNMMALKSGQDSLLVDAGSTLPGLAHFGIRLMIPDTDNLVSDVGMIHGLVLTHGHEDHIGAVPYIWNILKGNAYGTAITLSLLERKLKEHSIIFDNRLVEISPGSVFTVGVFKLEFIKVAHSLPGSVAVAIETPAGLILHTGDYKMNASRREADQTDKSRLSEIGAETVLAMFGDSTNALVSGYTASEEYAYQGLENLFTTADTRIFVATFSSSLNRIKTLFELAQIYGRRVFLLGRSLINNVELAQRLGCLNIPSNLYADKATLTDCVKKESLVILTGSQGEPHSALHRIATEEHSSVPLERGDVVAFSARVIPGNESRVGHLVNRLLRRGVKVIQKPEHPIHVSGHGSEEDLKEMLSLVKPRYTIPIHGEHGQLCHHSELVGAYSNWNNTALQVQNGDRLCFDSGDVWFGRPIEVGPIYIDQNHQSCDDGGIALRERRLMAEAGLLVITVGGLLKNGNGVIQLKVASRGLTIHTKDADFTERVKECVKAVIASASPSERVDLARLDAEIQGKVRTLFRSKNRVCPQVLTVFTETL